MLDSNYSRLRALTFTIMNIYSLKLTKVNMTAQNDQFSNDIDKDVHYIVLHNELSKM